MDSSGYYYLVTARQYKTNTITELSIRTPAIRRMEMSSGVIITIIICTTLIILASMNNQKKK
jgi:hypothetical protein